MDAIEHDPYVLISLLSAWHEGEWTLADVRPTLQMLFDRQYTLTENVVKERRYYIETDTWTDEDGNTHTDSYRVYYDYYICTVTLDKHNRLEAAVLFAIQYQVSTAVSYSEIVARINAAPLKKSQSHRLNDQIAAKEKELTKITRYKQSLYQDWKDGEISQQEYREMKADYERQAAGLSDLLARLTAERKQLSNGVDQQHPALVAFAKYQNIEKLTREILIELVDHIKVYENGNISVHFKFADEFRRIAEYIEINTTDTAEAG